MRPILAALLCYFILSPASAEERRLELPHWFELLYLNGGSPSPSLLGPQDYPLQAGMNLMVVRYGDNIEIRRDDSEVITSAPLAIWLDADTPGRYRLTSARPATLADAETFARAPQLQLLLQDKARPITQRLLTGLGALPSQRELELAIRDAAPQAINQPVSNAATAAHSHDNDAAGTLEPQRLQELQQLYRSSDQATRKRFRHWLIEQD